MGVKETMVLQTIDSVSKNLNNMVVHDNDIQCPGAPKKRHIQLYDSYTNTWSFKRIKKSPMELIKEYSDENKEN